MDSVPLENPNTVHNWKTKFQILFDSNQCKSNYLHMTKATKMHSISLSQYENICSGKIVRKAQRNLYHALTAEKPFSQQHHCLQKGKAPRLFLIISWLWKGGMWQMWGN